METTINSFITTMSSKGQMVLPRPFREKLGISTGAKILLEMLENGQCLISANPSSINSFFGSCKTNSKTKDARKYDDDILSVIKEENK